MYFQFFPQRTAYEKIDMVFIVEGIFQPSSPHILLATHRKDVFLPPSFLLPSPP